MGKDTFSTTVEELLIQNGLTTYSKQQQLQLAFPERTALFGAKFTPSD